jgi:hypothetical protein
MPNTLQETNGNGRKPGGQPNNRSGLRHGLRGGQLPKDAKYIEYRLNDFRLKLEDAVLAQRGEVTLMDAACIQTCLRWERHSALALRWLVKAGDTLDPVTRLHFSREIAKASTERDKSLAMLKLGRDQHNDVITGVGVSLPPLRVGSMDRSASGRGDGWRYWREILDTHYLMRRLGHRIFMRSGRRAVRVASRMAARTGSSARSCR